MKLYRRLLIVCFLLVPLIGSSQTNCNTLPKIFNSYSEAVSKVKSAQFSHVDYVNTARSSVITSASYYSCDGEKGFLIVGINNRPYIHTGIPNNLWQDFKKARSFGSFYNSYIRNRYSVVIK